MYLNNTLKFDSSEAENTYAALSAGLNTFAMNTLASYKDLVEQLQKTIIELETKLTELKKKYGETEKHPLEDK